MAETLTAVEGPLKGTKLRFEEGTEWIIGRDPAQCQITLEEPDISRRHILARKTPEGLVIENLSDTNPTLVNDQVLAGPQLLKAGDILQIGSTTFSFTANGAADPIPEEAPEEEPPLDGEEEHHDTLLGEEGEKKDVTEVHFDLLETGRWILKVVAGPNNGAEFPLQSGQSYVIGTDPAHCDIIFHDISVSRQHARLTLREDGTIQLEDLGSRNGSFIEEEKIEGQRPLDPNKLVTIGTSTFIIIDNEGERNTIISPLLPSIVKVLQKEIKREEPPPEREEEPEEEEEEAEPKKPRFSLLGAFILITLLSGIFALAGIAFSTLFKTHEVAKQKIDYNEELRKIISPYPAVRYSFNEPLGRLLLVGHVLSAVDRSQLLYDLHSLAFIKDIDDNVVIDEYVWREINQVLGQNADWKGVAVIAPAPGKFILTGFLDSRKQADSLAEYINQNFPYPDLLENKVVVKEELMAKVTSILRNNNLGTINPIFADGDIKLNGVMSYGMKANIDKAIDQIKTLPGVRSVVNLVLEQKPQEAVINISDKYKVTGSAVSAGGSTTVVLNGKLIGIGDVIDGMRITEVEPNYILLEKNGITYRIDYNQ